MTHSVFLLALCAYLSTIRTLSHGRDSTTYAFGTWSSAFISTRVESHRLSERCLEHTHFDINNRTNNIVSYVGNGQSGSSIRNVYDVVRSQYSEVFLSEWAIRVSFISRCFTSADRFSNILMSSQDRSFSLKSISLRNSTLMTTTQHLETPPVHIIWRTWYRGMFLHV